jgi:hypothetical protein
VKVCLRFAALLLLSARGDAQELRNATLVLSVDPRDGSYELATLPARRRIVRARVAAQIGGTWRGSSDYPRHDTVVGSFEDELGPGRELKVSFDGQGRQPDLTCVLRLYAEQPYGTVQVFVKNGTDRDVQVQAVRVLDAVGDPILGLGGRDGADRVLSDSFSEDWPDLVIYDLGKAPGGKHRGAGSQLIFNRESQQGLFVGALTADRFLTLSQLSVQGSGDHARIESFRVESTGTTDVQKDFALLHSPAEDQVVLSVPLAPGATLASERVLFEAGHDYHQQLLSYGDAIRRLHKARVSVPTPMGWWSWTAYYGGINEGETLANADWQAEHLKSLGYNYLQVDEGYQYARGEYTTSNRTQFPDGMAVVGRHVTENGLTFGVWTAPFEVTERAFVFEHHKDWLVHNAQGRPIPIGKVWNQDTDVRYALDTTHPEAQDYMRQTYRKLVGEWGVRFIKLDFMDTTAIEGYHYRPNTSALEALRIGLQVIRDAVGDAVVLDKDGSPMLTPVGLVDTGRVSGDTGHSFERIKTAAPGVSARFYMHRNFFLNDPDAFNVTNQYLVESTDAQPSLSLREAQASIALSAISGGMFEIGDDMLILGAEADRLALVENADLLAIPKIGRAATPMDLMTYAPEDGQPSVFLLRESPRQAILTVFNWTTATRSRSLPFSTLGLDAGHAIVATDILNLGEAVALSGGSLQLDQQAPQSVRMMKLVDTTRSPAAPDVAARVPATARAGETIELSAETRSGGTPAVGYHWTLGDGTHSDLARVSHCYTRAGDFGIQLVVDGVDGVAARQTFSLKVTGVLNAVPDLKENRRLEDPTGH